MEDARARKFDCLLVWKLDRFGRSLVDCLNNIQELEHLRVRFIAVTQNLDTDEKNPASRFLLHVLGGSGIRAFPDPGKDPGRADSLQGRLCSRESWKDCFQSFGQESATSSTKEDFQPGSGGRIATSGVSIRQIADRLGLGVGTVVRTLQARSKSS